MAKAIEQKPNLSYFDRVWNVVSEYQTEKNLDPQTLMSTTHALIDKLKTKLSSLVEEGVRQAQLEQFNLEVSKRKEQWEALKSANPDVPPFRLKRQFSNKSTVQVGPFTTNIFMEKERA
jgi:hypothetical protein